MTKYILIITIDILLIVHKVLYYIYLITSFRLWENSVHVHECSPFWVGIFIIFKKKTTTFTVLCRHANSAWQSTEAFVYVIGKSNVM